MGLEKRKSCSGRCWKSELTWAVEVEIKLVGLERRTDGRTRGKREYQRHGNSTVRWPTEEEYLGAKSVVGRITEDGRRKNAKCMNWHENVECRKWRMEIRRYNRAFYQKKMHLENGTNSSLQNTFVISIWFYFLRKTTKKNGKKKKLLNVLAV